MHVRSDVINALLPTVACFIDSRFSTLQRAISHAIVGNNALMTSERTRIDDMYESYEILWDQPHWSSSVLVDVVVALTDRGTDHFCCFVPGPEIAFPFALADITLLLSENK